MYGNVCNQISVWITVNIPVKYKESLRAIRQWICSFPCLFYQRLHSDRGAWKKRHHRVNFLRAATRMQSSHRSDSIWCAEPLNPILIPQSQIDSGGNQPHLSSWSHSTNDRVAGAGAFRSDLCLQHPLEQPLLLCCVKYKKETDGGRISEEATGEREGDPLGIGVDLVCGVHPHNKWQFGQCKQPVQYLHY